MKKLCQNCKYWGWPTLDKPQAECPRKVNTTLPHYGGSCTAFTPIIERPKTWYLKRSTK